MIRKISLLLLLCTLTLVSSACWDRKEIDKLAIVIGFGVDLIPGPKPYLLTAQIVNPTALQKGKAGGGSTETKPFVVTLAQGESIYDAIRNFSMDSPRRLFFSHNSILVIGERMARSGVQPILDFFERDPQFRRTMWVLVTPRTAKEVLESKLDLNSLSAMGVEMMIREFHQSSAVKVVQRKDFMSNLASKSSSAAASRIDLYKETAIVQQKLQEADGNKPQDQKSDHSSAYEEQQEQLRLNGTALFHKDKLAGYMNEQESRGLLWILGEIKGGAVVAGCPNQEKGKTVFRVNHTHAKLTPAYEKDGLSMHIEIEEEGAIAEVSCKKLDISKPETIKELEKTQAEIVEKRIMSTVQKAQSLKSDVVKFGEAFHRKDPKKWKQMEADWGKHFAQVKVTVHVTSKIRRVGMTSKPVIVAE
ncbi:Ger(x)C family spore germination protein [Paenibacillus sp. UNC451MF]|uniref:Ger(x)C family spore germination protein n=1 Tax=Paenibacillus sp. UNC451MF TaxID=1449063 RepID=UPI00048A4885|nr:Ger(x)C family spore germination protein [Paenibacillus sp. UNC451MF]